MAMNVSLTFSNVPVRVSSMPRCCIPSRPISPIFMNAGNIKTKPTIYAGEDDCLIDFITGKKKATDVAHMLWKHILREGDFAIDATCGNGNDTLVLAKLVCTESGKGLVHGIDIQESAIQKTSKLLDSSLTSKMRQQVRLFLLCHSRMEDVVPAGLAPRLVTFNLGYMPQGDKEFITKPDTTIQALEFATQILECGGLISILSYLGHKGGWEEYEAIKSFAKQLPKTNWVSSEHLVVNRVSCPVLILLYKI